MSRPAPTPRTRRLPYPQSRLRRAARSACLAAFVLTAGTSASLGDSYADREAALRAAFLFNFAKFAQWPSGRFASPQDAVTFCILDGSLDAPAMQQLAGKTIDGRPIRFHSEQGDAPLDACHLVYASETTSAGPMETILQEARRKSVLFVSDDPAMADAGGHISLFPVGGKLRFKVNVTAVRTSGIQLSSKFLQLALIVQ